MQDLGHKASVERSSEACAGALAGELSPTSWKPAKTPDQKASIDLEPKIDNAPT